MSLVLEGSGQYYSATARYTRWSDFLDDISRAVPDLEKLYYYQPDEDINTWIHIVELQFEYHEIIDDKKQFIAAAAHLQKDAMQVEINEAATIKKSWKNLKTTLQNTFTPVNHQKEEEETGPLLVLQELQEKILLFLKQQ